MYFHITGTRRCYALIIVGLLMAPIPFLHIPAVEASSSSANESRSDVAVIQIFMDAEMEDAADQHGWEGNGTADDPYIIEGLDIDCSGHQYGLSIHWVHHHFIVRNNTFRNLDWHTGIDPAGLSLSQTWNATVVGNVIRDCSPNGIVVDHTSRVSIENNTFIDNRYHVYLKTYSILTA